MNGKVLVSAAASAAMMLVMGANAFAADPAPSSSTSRNNAYTFVDHEGQKGSRDVMVAAGIDVSTVELHFAGAEKLDYLDVGTLRITNSDGSTWTYRPRVYQMVNGKEILVNLEFHIKGSDRVALKGKVNPNAPLIIGPVGSSGKGNS